MQSGGNKRFLVRDVDIVNDTIIFALYVYNRVCVQPTCMHTSTEAWRRFSAGVNTKRPLEERVRVRVGSKTICETMQDADLRKVHIFFGHIFSG